MNIEMYIQQHKDKLRIKSLQQPKNNMKNREKWELHRKRQAATPQALTWGS